jgi:hypothetical protein
MNKLIALLFVIYSAPLYSQVVFTGKAINLLNANHNYIALVNASSRDVLTIFPAAGNSLLVTMANDTFHIENQTKDYIITDHNHTSLLHLNRSGMGAGGKLVRNTGELMAFRSCRQSDLCILNAKKECLVKGGYTYQDDSYRFEISANLNDKPLIIAMAYTLLSEAKLAAESNNWLNAYMLFTPKPLSKKR